MFELILENQKGAQLSFGMNSPFTITEIEGLNPPSATLNMSEVALMDGGKYNSGKVNMRTLNIAFAIENAPAKNRLTVYNVLKSKQQITMYYQSAYRDLYIQGYIESIDVGYFDQMQAVTVTILCPSPYFRGAQEIVNELSAIVNNFHFAFAITEEEPIPLGILDPYNKLFVMNNGDVDCGMVIELYAKSAITNPKIFDNDTGDYFGVSYTMQAGDVITINTNKGEKTVTLTRDATETNIFNYIMQGSTWLQLASTGTTYVYEVGSGEILDLFVDFYHNDLYEGV